MISRRLAEKLGAFLPLREPYELKTADKNGRLKITGEALVEVVFQGVSVSGRVLFRVAENIREGLEVIIGRPGIDAWDIVFTPGGPKPRKVPIEFEII